MPQTNLNKVINHYRKKKYSNIWINFDTEPCNLAYSESLRYIRQSIKNNFKSMDVVLYSSHIGKEINPNIRDTKVAASDILTQFNGADI